MSTLKKEILKTALNAAGCLCVVGLAIYAGSVAGDKISKL